MDLATITPVVLTLVVNGLGLAVMWGKVNERVTTQSSTSTQLQEDLASLESEVTRLREDNSKLSVALWGIDGQNGLRGNIKELTNKMEGVRTDIQLIRNEMRDFTNSHQRIEDRLKDLMERLNP